MLSQVRPVVDYDLLVLQADALLSGETDLLANAANFAAFIFEALPQANWAGFYFSADDGLVLGPFCGKPACTRLAHGRGVCGEATRQMRTILVDDVNAFADHIACDSNSRSEVVVPIIFDKIVAGVFDVDSPELAGFTPTDQAGIERLVTTFLRRTAFPARLRRGRTTLCDELARAICEYRLEHADILVRFDGIDIATLSPEQAFTYIEEIAPITLAHMRHEATWLFPRLMQGGDMLKKRSEHIAREANDAAAHLEEFLETWMSPQIISDDITRFRSEFRSVERTIRGRIAAEEEDLFTAALAEFGR